MIVWFIFSILTLVMYLTAHVSKALEVKGPFGEAFRSSIKKSSPAAWFVLFMMGPLGFTIAGVVLFMTWSD